MGYVATLISFIWAGCIAAGLYFILPGYKKQEIKEFFHIE